MTLPVRLRRVAQAEYDADADVYEAQRRGRGQRFVAAVDRALSQLAGDADRWPEVEPGIRLAPVARWPYGIYYQTWPDQVMVLAVFHMAREPADWQRRA